MKHEIEIVAITEKGRAAMTHTGEGSKQSTAALRICGIKEMTISEDPLIKKVTLKRVPMPVVEQIEISLITKFIELGAVRNVDYKILVLK